MARNSKDEKVRIQPSWLFIIILAIGFAFGLWSLCRHEYLELGTYLVLVILAPYGIIHEGWGYDLDRTHFTIRFLGIPLERVPWESVRQVVYIKRLHGSTGYKRDLRKREFIRVTLDPAEPIPYLYKDLGSHWRLNLFLVWNIYFWDPQTKGKVYLEAFQKYWGEVEIREYNE